MRLMIFWFPVCWSALVPLRVRVNAFAERADQ